MPAHSMVFDDDRAMQDMFVVLLEEARRSPPLRRVPTGTVGKVEETAPDVILVDWMHGRSQRGMRLIERLAA